MLEFIRSNGPLTTAELLDHFAVLRRCGVELPSDIDIRCEVAELFEAGKIVVGDGGWCVPVKAPEVEKELQGSLFSV